jgi:ubiquinone/menaquinone biosynthesis C-methylase UbiE
MNTAEYERMYRLEDSYWWFVGRHRLVESLLSAHYGSPGKQATPLSFLDIGCGTGAMSARLQKWGTVVSADFSSLALSFSHRRGLKHLVGADAMRLPFAAGQFDALIAMDMLEHLPDDATALCEFYRVLKPGGRVIATIPAYPELWSEHDVALMHFRRYLRQQVSSRFVAAGFQIEKLSHTMMLLYPVVKLQRRLNAKKPPHDPPQAAMPLFPAPINSLLTGIVTLENGFARRFNFPVGVTILCIARKPE